jgi:hypothetical protein
MIWIKSTFSGLQLMVVGSFLCLATYLYYLGQKAGPRQLHSWSEHTGLLRDPISLLILLA